MTDSSRSHVRPRYALVRRHSTPLLDLQTFAYAAGLHPEFVRRLVTLGLLEADRDAAGRLSLPPGQLTTAARIQRLRAGLSLNYAAIGLVMDLLDRIETLETALRRSPQRPSRSTGTLRTR